jgi:trimethylamine--corrinoid protein Co-methyltransferase
LIRPKLTLLDDTLIDRVLEEACQLLEDPGVRVHSRRGLELLDGAGARIDGRTRTAYIPSDLVQKCLETVPSAFKLYTTGGQPAVSYEGDTVQFDPGSTAIEILDHGSRRSRRPVTHDLIAATRLADALPAMDAASTCMVASDVPEAISDLYRLFLVLMNSRKPVVTGAFGIETWAVMRDLLIAVAGSDEALRAKPIAVFDVCPSPPLKWTEITCENLIDCALNGIPAQLVSMPMTGAAGPVTLLGAVVQHAAETLSGIVIHQLAGPGAPIVWGGAPVAFDMRTGNASFGAVETNMIDAAYAQVGKRLGIPTHAYMGTSDSKIVDAQAGFESAAGVFMAALAGVNMVSSAGMLDFERCFSLEKLVIDAEIVGMARRLTAGLEPRGESLAVDIMREVGHEGVYLEHDSTLRWFRKELLIPSSIIDREFRLQWEQKGAMDTADRAHQRVEKLLQGWQPVDLPAEVLAELERITLAAARSARMEALPARQT